MHIMLKIIPKPFISKALNHGYIVTSLVTKIKSGISTSESIGDHD